MSNNHDETVEKILRASKSYEKTMYAMQKKFERKLFDSQMDLTDKFFRKLEIILEEFDDSSLFALYKACEDTKDQYPEVKQVGMFVLAIWGKRSGDPMKYNYAMLKLIEMVDKEMEAMERDGKD